MRAVSAVVQRQCLRADGGVVTTAAHQAKKQRGCAPRATSGGRLLAQWGRVQARARRTQRQERRRWQATAQGAARQAAQTTARTKRNVAQSCHGQIKQKTWTGKVLVAEFFLQKFCMQQNQTGRMLKKLRRGGGRRDDARMRRYR